MRCPVCGTESNAKFCTNCGAKLYDQKQSQAPQMQRPVNNYSPIPSPAHKKKNSALSVFALILSLLGPLAIVGIVLAIIDIMLDMARNNSHKHGISIAAIIIGAISLVLVIVPSNKSKTDDVASSEKNVQTGLEEAQVEDTQTENSAEAQLAPIEEQDQQKDEVPAPAEAVEETPAKSQDEESSVIPEASKEEFIASCNELNYKAIARDPDSHIGDNYYYTCYVASAREGGFFSGYQKYYVTYAFDLEEAQKAVSDGWADDLSKAKMFGADYDTCVWLLDNRDASDPEYIKILDEDIIKVYGTFNGMTSTKNSLTKETGEQVSLDIKYVELIAE